MISGEIDSLNFAQQQKQNLENNPNICHFNDIEDYVRLHLMTILDHYS